MARIVLSVHELDERNCFAPTFSALVQAVDATAGAEFDMRDSDCKYLLLIQNSASSEKSVTIKAGNGLQGTTDLSTAVAAGSYTCIALESGYFKNVSGDDKGKVILTGASADIKAAVFKLP